MVEDSNVIHSSNQDGEALVLPKQKRVSVCMGCGQEIFDQFILRVSPDLEWHAACLKCADCNQYLDESCTCFVRDGKTYCKADYIKLFGAKCAKCHQNFNKNDYVMRARHKIYHIGCFHCAACSHMLKPGDEFALREEKLYCKADHDVLDQQGFPPLDIGQSLDFGSAVQAPLTPLGNGQLGGGAGLPGPLSAGSLQPLGTPVGSEPCLSVPPTSNATCSSSGGEQPSESRKEKKKDKPKTTRVRTVLNEKQLHTLRTCYGANPRPDALMKEQLVEMTGLSPRVIRVWFQNKRCKDKKRQILMKQMEQQQQKNQALNGVRMQGMGPLIAASPTRHDPMPIVQGLDVQQFHQNPGLWASMATEPSTMDSQTPFQQLMHGFGDASGDSWGAGAASFRADSELDSFSPQMAPSDLSSPSCSE